MSARYNYDECVKMPTFNVIMMVYNKCLQQSKKKIIYMYEMIVDDLISAFMHIANYISWLRGVSTSKGYDYIFLKLKAIARYGNPKLLENP